MTSQPVDVIVGPEVRGRQARGRPPRALVPAIALVLAVGSAALALAPIGIVLLLAVLLAWCAVPGIALCLQLYGRTPGSVGTSVLLGSVWGFALSSAALLAWWVAGARHPALLLTAPLLALAATWPLARLAGPLTPPSLDRRDLIAVLLLLLVVPIVVGRPYAQVGTEVPEGRAYRAYFTADFVWKMAVVAELSKGDIPPRNQFLRDSDLHYYWLPHLLSAAEYRHLAAHVRLEHLLLTNALYLGLVFVAFLYAFARQFVRSPAAAALGCAGAILFTSFEGTDRLIVLWREGLPLDTLRTLNIDAVARWFYGALPVDGLHRLLLYQPQHHAMGYAVGLSGLLVVAQARHAGRFGLMFFAGCLLGLCMLLSAFSAIMITSITAIYVLLVLVRDRRWQAVPVSAAGGALPLVAALGIAFALGYVDRSASVAEIIVNPMAFMSPVWTIFLSLGPMLLPGLAGLAIAVNRREDHFLIPGLIVGVSFFFYFFVNVRDVQYVYVGWRAGHLVYIACAALAGFAMAELWRARRAVRIGGIAALVLIALAAAPKTIIDLYNTQDIDNRTMGPGFPWTLVLSHDEVQVLEWIRTATPQGARVQVEPWVRHPATWSYVPAFAERRMAAGLPISMVPLDRYEAASERVRAIYSAESPELAYENAVRAGVDYLVIGPPERTVYPQVEPMLDESPLLRLRFRNAAFSVYEVARQRRFHHAGR